MIPGNGNNSVNVIDVPYQTIDLDALENIKSQAEKLFEVNQFRILMNMSSVDYLSSTGLGLLVYINNKCTENGGKFGVFGLQEYTLDMLKLTKLDSVINIFDTKDIAEQALSA
ncbi:MAG: STAS domain-containing protein [Cyanobacteriota bacterium]